MDSSCSWALAASVINKMMGINIYLANIGSLKKLFVADGSIWFPLFQLDEWLRLIAALHPTSYNIIVLKLIPYIKLAGNDSFFTFALHYDETRRIIPESSPV
jgi:hypothetical protein